MKKQYTLWLLACTIIMPLYALAQSSLAPKATVILSSATIPDGTIKKGGAKEELQRFDISVADANATLTGLTLTTLGMYDTSDITTLRVFYSSDAVFSGNDELLSAKTLSLGPGTHVMPSFTPKTIMAGSTGYLFISTSLSNDAVTGNTIRIAATPLSYFSFADSVNVTGPDPIAAAGLMTFTGVAPSINITSDNPSVPASSLMQGATNQVIHRFAVSASVSNGSVRGITISTSGSYATSDFSNLKIWYSADANFSIANDRLLAVKQSIPSAGLQDFDVFASQLISKNTTSYFFITIDVPCTAAAGNTISVNSITAANLTFASGNVSGSAAGSGTHTIAYTSPANVVSCSALARYGSVKISVEPPASGNCFDELMVVAATSPITAVPTGDGNSYSGNPAFGSGSVLGNGYIVYKGLSLPQVVTGLVNGTLYYFKVFTRRGSIWSSGVEVSAVPSPLVQPGELLITGFSYDYGASASDEFVEIVNTTDRSINLSALAIKYQSANGTAGTAGGMLSGTIAPYSYWLLSPNATISVGKSVAVPRDGVIGGGFSDAGGQIAIVRLDDDVKIDGLGWAATSGTYFEGTTASLHGGNKAFKRKLETQDTDNNIEDFEVAETASIHVRNAASRLVVAGVNVPAGNYAHLSVTGTAAITGNATVSTLALVSGSLEIGSHSLTINGAVECNNGTVSSDVTSTLIINGTAGTVRFSENAGLKDLILNNNASITLGTTINMAAGVNAGTVMVNTGAILNTGGNMVLKSDAGGTARVAEVNGIINGDVTVERFIPAYGRRAWRLLATPLNASSSPTIFESWQEAGALTAGYGTHITQIGGAGTNGFDVTGNVSSTSLRYYDGSILKAVSNTNATKLTDNGGVWFLFIRGDRNIDLTNAASTANTVLRMKGALNCGTVTTGIAGAGYSLIPNPYASNVDFEAIYNGNPGVTSGYYVWNANMGSLGAYATVERVSAGVYELTPSAGLAADNAARYIESGQAFYIPVNAQLQFTEAMKTANDAIVNTLRTPTTGEQIIINLYTVAGTATKLQDGVRVKYDSSYSKALTQEDIKKMLNLSINLGNLRDGELLAVEKRPFIHSNDTIFLKLTGAAAGNYKLEFTALQLATSGLEAMLVDSYLSTVTPLDLSVTTDVSFAITNDAASASSNRFMVVLRPSATLAINAINLFAALKGNAVQLSFATQGEKDIARYIVERSPNSSSFASLATLEAKNGSDNHYEFMDATAVEADNYYRVKAIDKQGRIQYSNVAHIRIDHNASKPFSVYPNPVEGSIANIRMNAAQGEYEVLLLNAAGQELFRMRLNHKGGRATMAIPLPAGLAMGSYVLKLVSAGSVHSQRILIK